MENTLGEWFTLDFFFYVIERDSKNISVTPEDVEYQRRKIIM